MEQFEDGETKELWEEAPLMAYLSGRMMDDFWQRKATQCLRKGMKEVGEEWRGGNGRTGVVYGTGGIGGRLS